MTWLLLLVIGAGLVMVVRFYQSLRKARQAHEADWDSKLISQLRAKGQDPFQPHTVDYFFALPDEQATTAINQALEKEGFRVDVKAVPDSSAEFPFSLHATKSLRLHAMEMRERSKRFNELAVANRGRYDGWSSE
ncbi:MAG: ribonuclease E inhibitor RraB [Gammaproteobacteria bacterium]